MAPIDWAYAGTTATKIAVLGLFGWWITQRVAAAVVEWEGIISDEAVEDQPDLHQMMPGLAPMRIARDDREDLSALARIDTSLDAMDADEHVAGFVG